MKKFSILAFMAVLAICFTSCDKNQSSFDIEDIETKAKITGKITANTGFDYLNQTVITQATGVTVVVEIPNSDLSPNSNAQGNARFTTYTDNNGEYTIEVPVAPKGANIVIKAEEYLGDYTTVSTIQYQVAYEKVVYQTAARNLSIKPNEIWQVNFEYKKK